MTSSIIPREGNLTAIISAELEWRDAARNGLDHIELRDRLARQLAIGELYSVQECDGAYKGTPERSIAITGPAGRTLAIARREAERFSQESILVVDHHGQGKLYFTGNGESYSTIGTYSPLHGAADAWTRVVATGEAFTFI